MLDGVFECRNHLLREVQHRPSLATSSFRLDLTMPGTNGVWFWEQQLMEPAVAHVPLIVVGISDRRGAAPARRGGGALDPNRFFDRRRREQAKRGRSMSQLHFDEPPHLTGLDGRTQQIPLPRVATLFFHRSQLVRGFNTISAHGHSKVVGDANNRGQDSRLPFPGARRSHQPLTRLHCIQWQSVESGEHSHFSSEIVKCKANTALLYVIEQLFRESRVPQHTLAHLQLQHRRGHPGFIEYSCECFRRRGARNCMADKFSVRGTARPTSSHSLYCRHAVSSVHSPIDSISLERSAS